MLDDFAALRRRVVQRRLRTEAEQAACASACQHIQDDTARCRITVLARLFRMPETCACQLVAPREQTLSWPPAQSIRALHASTGAE